MAYLLLNVSIPVWLLALLIAAWLPLLYKLFRLVYHLKRGNLVKEEHQDEVVWRIRSTRSSAAPRKSVADVAKEKRHEEKTEIVQLLKIMNSEGERGILIQSIADRMDININKARKAVEKLVAKKFIEEVVGMSGTKYYLTQVGKDYCSSKGIR